MTVLPLVAIVSPRCLPPVVGKLARLMTWPPRTQESGTPRPTTREPSDRWAASESSSTRLALAMPQACGDEPLPASGWVPVQGEPGLGNCWLSHHEYGPLWPLRTMNSYDKMPWSR